MPQNVSRTVDDLATRFARGDVRLSERNRDARPHPAPALPLVRSYGSCRALCGVLPWCRDGLRVSHQRDRQERALMLDNVRSTRTSAVTHGAAQAPQRNRWRTAYSRVWRCKYFLTPTPSRSPWCNHQEKPLRTARLLNRRLNTANIFAPTTAAHQARPLRHPPETQWSGLCMGEAHFRCRTFDSGSAHCATPLLTMISPTQIIMAHAAQSSRTGGPPR
jgi:hypothetical protein